MRHDQDGSRRRAAAQVETAFAGWEMLAAEPADTAGLGWPMNKTAPHWYRLRRLRKNAF